MTTDIKELFDLGDVNISDSVVDLFKGNLNELVLLLERHQVGNWGDVCKHDMNINQEHLTVGKPLLSCYKVECFRVYVITDIKRRQTFVVLSTDFKKKAKYESQRFRLGDSFKIN